MEWAGGEAAARIALFFGIATISLFFWRVGLFARVGRGTLAPWDPTQRLVAVGPYREVCNPIIIDVLAVLPAESLAVDSRLLLGWKFVFWLVDRVNF